MTGYLYEEPVAVVSHVVHPEHERGLLGRDRDRIQREAFDKQLTRFARETRKEREKRERERQRERERERRSAKPITRQSDRVRRKPVYPHVYTAKGVTKQMHKTLRHASATFSLIYHTHDGAQTKFTSTTKPPTKKQH